MKHLIKQLSAGDGKNRGTLTDMCRNLEVPARNLSWRADFSLEGLQKHIGGYAAEASLPLINDVEERLQTPFAISHSHHHSED